MVASPWRQRPFHDVVFQQDVFVSQPGYGDRPRHRQHSCICPWARHRPQRTLGGRDRDDQWPQDRQGGRQRSQDDDGQDAGQRRGHPPAARRRHRRHLRRRADDQLFHPQGAYLAFPALSRNRHLRAVGIDLGREARHPRCRQQRRGEPGLSDRGTDGGGDWRGHAGHRTDRQHGRRHRRRHHRSRGTQPQGARLHHLGARRRRQDG